jgi:RNA recognition motif-containing protein
MKAKAAVKIEGTQKYDIIGNISSQHSLIHQTSNIFVANLPPHVTEQSLGNFFARIGPVGSVSISFVQNQPRVFYHPF